jgi:L-ascorbate metabolism protein UlaG (beta-lactamase superfamily)
MANDAGAKYILPIHHMTFNFGKESQLEPIQRFEKALERERIALREVGETFTL